MILFLLFAFPPLDILACGPLLTLVVLGVGVDADPPLQVVLQILGVGEVVAAAVAEGGVVVVCFPSNNLSAFLRRCFSR